MVSFRVLFSRLLCVGWVLSDLFMDFFIKLRDRCASAFLEAFVPGSELESFFFSSLNVIHIVLNVFTQNSSSEDFVLFAVNFSWESLLTMRDIQSSISCSFHDSEHL